MRRTTVRLAFESFEDRCVPAVLTVDTAADNNIRDRDLSLREAVLIINGKLSAASLTAQEQTQVNLGQPLGDNDTIGFASALKDKTIILTLNDDNLAFGPTALALTTSMTIDGTNAPGLKISGNKTHRIFAVGAGANVSLRNLTLKDGRAQGGDGGNVLTPGSSGFGGGGAAGMGGAIYSIGALSINGVAFASNTASGGNGGVGRVGDDIGGAGGGGVGGNGGDFARNPNAGKTQESAGGGGVGGPGESNRGLNGSDGGANENGDNAHLLNGALGGGGSGAVHGLIENGGSGTDLSSGGFGGGGGGSRISGGNGGFGSGGGSGYLGVGGNGGFGGGGGGNPFEWNGVGQGGFGGGDGNNENADWDRKGGGGAGLGGAIFNYGGTLTVVNSTFTANVAVGGSGANSGQGLGGAIFSRNGSAKLTQVTISGNTAKQGGRGVFIVGDGATAAAVISNSILGQANAEDSDFASATINGGAVSTAGSTNNLVRNNSAEGGLDISAIVSSANPKLSALTDNGGCTRSMALLPGSPARDSGNAVSAVGLAADVRGLSRIVGSAVDIGAVEAELLNPKPAIKATPKLGLVSSSRLSLFFLSSTWLNKHVAWR